MSSLDTLITQGANDQEAIALGDGIYASRGVANTYLVQTRDGNVMINTGLHWESPQTKARFAAASSAPLRSIIFTQGHPDHVFGWSDFNGPGVETIAQANHSDVREYWRGLHPFYVRRIMKLWGAVVGDIDVSDLPPEPVLTTSFVDSHAFELGGRRFELYATPGGEALDALIVWLPESKTVFIGNLMGPMFGHVPNLYTVRGDKIRSAMSFIHALDRVLALEPEVLINGHDVFRGAQIQQTIDKVRSAILYLREKTIAGMNAGTDLWTLMQTITLPDALAMPQVHGKVSWIVRAIWEEHSGWFRYESTTELYGVPPSSVWAELVELAGRSALVERARRHADAKRPLQALHFTDIVLSQEPMNAEALHIKRMCMQQLLEDGGRENFSESQWLQSEITLMDAAVAPASHQE